MQATQLNDFLMKEALNDTPVENPGPIYSTLCRTFPLHRFKNKKQHSLALAVLTKLSEYLRKIGKVSSQEKDQILDYMNALGLIAEEYERKRFAADLNKVSGADILEFLMEQHSLKQTDLENELGSQSIVSEILSRKRKLNSQQIYALSKRFGVSPSVFFPSS